MVRIIKLMDNLLNKKNNIFPLETLEHLLAQGWKTGTPSCISHDYKAPFAWVTPMSLLLERGLCSLIGKIYIPKNDEEHKYLISNVKKYIFDKHYNLSENTIKKITNEIDIELSDDAMFVNFGFDGVIDKDIVIKKFPQLFENIDKKGLILLNSLNELAPGVFEIDRFIIFAHQYFRRSLSRLNSLNDEFLIKLSEVGKNNNQVKIAIDTDMIGLKESFFRTLEYEYWWGPKFNNDISKIKNGVCVHVADEKLKFFHKIEKTEFFWYDQDEKYVLECEEISNKEITNNNFNYGARYVHSMLDKKTNKLIHLDGAIRGYTTEQMVKRLDITIKEQDRSLEYKKLWRVDGDIKLSDWKELICHYYRDNTLPGEYLKPICDEKLELYLKNKKDIDYNNLNYYDIKEGDGVKILISYVDKNFYSEYTDDFNLILNDYIINEQYKNFYVESCFFELEKLYKLEGRKINSNNQYLNIAFEDIVDNYPLIFHAGESSVDNANFTFNLFKKIINAYLKEKDRIMAINIGIEYKDRVVIFSLLGSIGDLLKDLTINDFKFPLDTMGISNWINNLYKNNMNDIKLLPLNFISPLGILKYKREIINQNEYKIEVDGNLEFVVFNNKKINDFILQNNLELAPINIIYSTICSNCGKDYYNCNCCKLNEEITITVKKYISFGVFITKHKV